MNVPFQPEECLCVIIDIKLTNGVESGGSPVTLSGHVIDIPIGI